MATKTQAAQPTDQATADSRLVQDVTRQVARRVVGQDYMVERLLMPKPDANLKYGAIQAFVYTMAFVGGLFADKILGFRKSIFWGGLLMIVGSFTIAFAPEDLFYIGTSISIVGTGFFKLQPLA